MTQPGEPRPRKALFAGGPWHGTIRPLPADAGIRINCVERTGPPSPATLDPTADVDFRQRSYTARRYQTLEVDGAALIEVWAYDDVPDDDYQQTLDAALRVLIRVGSLAHRFYPVHDTWRTREPRLAERERCTPDPNPKPRPWQEKFIEMMADAERSRHRRDEQAGEQEEQ
jgi:hypothetical protein